MRPTLIIVSGPPGSGKTTLAHRIAREIRCPAICRDEIKEGLLLARPHETPSPGDQATQDTYAAFFEVVELLLRHGVTHVAEAAFQHKLWAPKLEPLLDLAQIRIVRCQVSRDIARQRMARRLDDDPARRASHPDKEYLSKAESDTAFVPLELDVPTMTVDTTDGYRPAIDEIASFADS